LGKGVHLNRPDKMQISGFGLPPIAATKIKICVLVFAQPVFKIYTGVGGEGEK